MKKYTSRNFIAHSTFALALGMTLAVWTPAQAQTADATPAAVKAEGKMKERHQAMMSDMKAKNAALTSEVAKMNSAPADKKLDLLAAIVTQMVEQRTAMEGRMEKMKSEMPKDMPMSKASASPMKGMDEKPQPAKTEKN